MTRTAVFAYGSLVDPESVALTLGRPVEAMSPARLRGWRRNWTICRDNLSAEKTFAVKPGGERPRWILGLSIECDPGTPATDGPNGRIFEVSRSELERLDLREVRYDRIDVTEAVESFGAPAFTEIFGFTAKPANHAPVPPHGAVILASYERAVRSAFAAIGEEADYRRTTEVPPVPCVEGVLVSDAIPPGNPRDW